MEPGGYQGAEAEKQEVICQTVGAASKIDIGGIALLSCARHYNPITAWAISTGSSTGPIRRLQPKCTTIPKPSPKSTKPAQRHSKLS